MYVRLNLASVCEDLCESVRLKNKIPSSLTAARPALCSYNALLVESVHQTDDITSSLLYAKVQLCAYDPHSSAQ